VAVVRPRGAPGRSRRAQRARHALPGAGSVSCPPAHISSSSTLPPAIGAERDASAGRSGVVRGCRVWPSRAGAGPPLTGTQELHKLHRCLWMRLNPWQWHEPAEPMGDRHDAHVASTQSLSRRNGAAASPTGARTARRRHKAMRAARGRVLLVSFRGGLNNNWCKMTPMRRPRDHGQSPRTVRPPRPHPTCTSRSYPSCLGFGGVGVGPRHTVRRMQGCRDRSRGNCVSRCGILGSVGGGYRPCGRPAPSRHARTACAEALWLLQGMVVRRTTGHGGALTPGERTKGATDAEMRCTRCQGPPTHAQHDRRPRLAHAGPRAVVAGR
jgi:hypothetical protein